MMHPILQATGLGSGLALAANLAAHQFAGVIAQATTTVVPAITPAGSLISELSAAVQAGGTVGVLIWALLDGRAREKQERERRQKVEEQIALIHEKSGAESQTVVEALKANAQAMQAVATGMEHLHSAINRRDVGHRGPGAAGRQHDG